MPITFPTIQSPPLPGSIESIWYRYREFIELKFSLPASLSGSSTSFTDQVVCTPATQTQSILDALQMKVKVEQKQPGYLSYTYFYCGIPWNETTTDTDSNLGGTASIELYPYPQQPLFFELYFFISYKDVNTLLSLPDTIATDFFTTPISELVTSNLYYAGSYNENTAVDMTTLSNNTTIVDYTVPLNTQNQATGGLSLTGGTAAQPFLPFTFINIMPPAFSYVIAGLATPAPATVSFSLMDLFGNIISTGAVAPNITTGASPTWGASIPVNGSNFPGGIYYLVINESVVTTPFYIDLYNEASGQLLLMRVIAGTSTYNTSYTYPPSAPAASLPPSGAIQPPQPSAAAPIPAVPTTAADYKQIVLFPAVPT